MNKDILDLTNSTQHSVDSVKHEINILIDKIDNITDESLLNRLSECTKMLLLYYTGTIKNIHIELNRLVSLARALNEEVGNE